jgi:transposase-like protein
MAQHADASKEQLWLDLVRRWQQSQLSVRAFCQRHRLSEPSFYGWRRMLRQRGLLAEAPPSRPAFVKVVCDHAAAAPTPVIELVLEHGRLLRVPAGFDAELLRQLLRVLEEPAC